MIKFSKMHGNGNDYVYTQNFNNELLGIDVPMLARRLSNRNFGVGSDGLILAEGSKTADFKMIMYNADGSRGAMCGNGIRCLAKYVYDNGFLSKKDMSIETDSGIKRLTLEPVDNRLSYARVDMGAPKELLFNQLLKLNNYDVKVNALSMGNPHAVVLFNELSDSLKSQLVLNRVTHEDISIFSHFTSNELDSFDIEAFGNAMQADKLFSDGVNVEIISTIDESNIAMRVYERGSAETLSCGTGCCAAGVVAIKKGLVNKSVNVHTLGGSLRIDWNGNTDDNVYMYGPAVRVFDGEIAEDFC